MKKIERERERATSDDGVGFYVAPLCMLDNNIFQEKKSVV